MTNGSTDESAPISLPPDLAEWLDGLAAERDADRETVLVQLLAAHRAADTLADGETAGVDDVTVTTDLEAEVREVVADRLPDITDAVAEHLDVERQIADAVDARSDDTSESAADRAVETLRGRFVSEDEFTETIEDVRSRVVQVKKETDRKAPADHDHPDLENRLDDLATAVEELTDEVSDVRETLEEQSDNHDAEITDLADSLEDAREKLQTVAHVVNDLRERTAVETKRATSVENIKRRAAEHDLDRAACEACGSGVEIALMTEPECPHCRAAVTDVEPKQRFLGKPHLVTAHGIEAADDESP